MNCRHQGPWTPSKPCESTRAGMMLGQGSQPQMSTTLPKPKQNGNDSAFLVHCGPCIWVSALVVSIWGCQARREHLHNHRRIVIFHKLLEVNWGLDFYIQLCLGTGLILPSAKGKAGFFSQKCLQNKQGVRHARICEWASRNGNLMNANQVQHFPVANLMCVCGACRRRLPHKQRRTR